MNGSVLLQLLGGLALLTLGGSSLVRGSASLARRAGISPLVIGVTLVAFLTSAPEVAVSVVGAAGGQDDIAAANVVGSNIFNVLFVLGACALLKPLAVSQQLVLREIPIQIGVSVLLWLFAVNGNLSGVEGAVFLAGLALFAFDTVQSSRREAQAVRTEYDGGVPGLSRSASVDVAFVAGGLAALVVGGGWLVEAAVAIAAAAGVDEATIGLTIVAAGTSLPEVATSVAATLRGERDIAVGNVVGSSIFNVLGIVGLAALVSEDGLALPSSLVAFDLPLMVAVATACLPIVAGDHRISRPIGLLFLGVYGAYVAYLVMAAKSHAVLEPLSFVLVEFAAPLTVAAIGAYLYRRVRARRRSGAVPNDAV